MKNQEKQKEGLPRLLELAMAHKGLMCMAILLAILSAVASFIPYLAIYKVIQNIVSVYPDFSQLNQTEVLWAGGTALLGVFANVVLYLAALALSHIAAYGTICQLKTDFVSHLAMLPLGFHINTGSGRLRKIMDDNIEGLESFIAHDLPNTVAAFVSPLVMLVLVFVVDWRFGLMVLLGIICVFILQGSTMGGKKTENLIKEYQAALEDMAGASVEYVRGISVVKAFGQTTFSFKRLSDAIKRYTASVIPYSLSQENMSASLQTALNNIYLFLIPMGIWIGGHTSDYKTFVSTFIFYLIFVPAIATILMKVLYVMVNAQQSAMLAGRMDEVLGVPKLPEPEQPKTPQSYEVCFEHVTFRYEKASKQAALENVSFTAEPGKVTAVVGPSGGGKSTIANLIPRFYDVDSGSISIGGIDIRQVSMETLMDKVSFVFQDTYLFKQSILENIRMGRPGAAKEEVISAAKAAQCDEFISALPDGYDTVFGKSGTYFSGGEMQRISIARAILKDAPILVLDEATAFNDPENENLIQQALQVLMADKTVIMIAHRLSTVKGASQILVMDGGHLVQSGIHEQLIQSGGRYRELWNRYSEALSWKLEQGGSANA